MNEKAEAPLPASEFSPRAARPLHDSMFDLPVMTASRVRDRIAGLILDIEALKVVEGVTMELRMAKLVALMALNYVDAHERSQPAP